jgi:PAS domain S-box-containing protein
MKSDLTILIVEDNEDDQSLYRRALRDTGHTLVLARTAREGLDKVAEACPEIILLDYNLPDMSGLDFMENFARQSCAAIPIIMLTGEGNESIAVSAMKAGASDYMVKDIGGRYLRMLPTVIRRSRTIFEERQRAHRLGVLHQTILGTVADGILGIDAEGKILFANPASERILQCSSGQLVARSLTEFLRQEDPREEWRDHPLSQPPVGEEVVSRECDILFRQGGTSFPVAYSASPLDLEGVGKRGWVLVFHDISERKHVEEELIKTARYDTLTGLPNRLLFQDYFGRGLSRVARRQQHLALLFIDLDGFKAVNDTFGHLAGDLVSRFGGDEFTIVLEDSEPDQLAGLAERILQELAAPYDLSGKMAHVTASIGVALYPECGSEQHILIQKADAAMYTVKNNTKNNYQFCPELKALLAE